MSVLTIQMSKKFRDGPTIDVDVSIPIDDGCVTVVLGESGEGKTTLLRCIAGLCEPDAGRIEYGDEIWFDETQGRNLSPRDRRIGFCGPKPALFPHLDVQSNVAFGLPRDQRRSEMVRQWMAALEIGDLAQRRVDAISTGQAQRVALARTLILKPKFVLLDEPMASLDSNLRGRVRRWLRRTLKQSSTPAVVVSHDRDEATMLADHLVVLGRGGVLQSGPPAEVFGRPVDSKVANFIGVENVLHGCIDERNDEFVAIAVGDIHIHACHQDVDDGAAVVCIHGDSISLHPCDGQTSGSIRNHFPGVITSIQPGTAITRVAVTVNQQATFTASITRTAATEMSLRLGQPITVAIKATAIHIAAR